MTTEGEGNYEVKRFLEGEGAESDVQLLAAWILYSLWEVRYDAGERENLRGADTSYYGLGGSGPFGALKKKAISHLGDLALRGLFQSFAYSLGLYGLPPARHERDRGSGQRATTTAISAAAKATWRSAS